VIVLVGVGIAKDDPGMLIVYLIAIAPPVLATLARTLLLASKGEKLSAMDVFLTFLVSASMTLLVVTVLFVAAVVAFFVYCLYVCGNMGKI
jgi:hypothetical protein